jgi:hypothetical protein
MMDEETRRMLEEAYVQDDKVRADFERYEWLHGREQLKKRSGEASGLIFKTHEPAARPTQQRSATMDSATAAKWTEWVQAHIRNAFAEHNEQLTEAMGEVISEIRHELRKEFTEQVGALRTELTISSAIAKGEIAQLKAEVPSKRRNDAA